MRRIKLFVDVARPNESCVHPSTVNLLVSDKNSAERYHWNVAAVDLRRGRVADIFGHVIQYDPKRLKLVSFDYPRECSVVYDGSWTLENNLRLFRCSLR